MPHHEKTIMAFDDLGREYMIDVFDDARELGALHAHGATRGGLPSFRTHDGHVATYLGNGEFSITVPGETESVTVRTSDPEYV